MKRSKLRQLATPMLLVTVLTASGCGGQARIQAALPPAQDMRQEAKPEITEAVFTSDAAAAEYDSAVEAWGERGWAAIARICRWAKAHGSKQDCD